MYSLLFKLGSRKRSAAWKKNVLKMKDCKLNDNKYINACFKHMQWTFEMIIIHNDNHNTVFSNIEFRLFSNIVYIYYCPIIYLGLLASDEQTGFNTAACYRKTGVLMTLLTDTHIHTTFKTVFTNCSVPLPWNLYTSGSTTTLVSIVLLGGVLFLRFR